MKFGLTVIIGVLIGAVASNFLMDDKGYVLIQFRGWSVEMSVPAMLLVLIALYFGVRSLIRIWKAPKQIGEAAARARAKKASKQAVRGYIEMAGGNFSKGEKLLTRGVRRSETPLLNYLGAAQAAQAQGDSERRDSWLKMARDQDPEAEPAILLTRADMQLESGDTDGAIESLQLALEKDPKQPGAKRRLTEMLIDAGDYAEALTLLPALKKDRNLSREKLDDWTVAVYSGLLAQPASERADTATLYKGVPRPLRNHPRILQTYAQALAADGQVAAAEKLLRKSISRDWNTDLVAVYAGLETGDKAAHLKHAEAWLRDHPEDPDLLLAAGRLCIRNELWGKARSYIESSIAVRPTPLAYNQLGQLMLKLGENDSASAAFQEGLAMSHPDTTRPKLSHSLAADEDG